MIVIRDVFHLEFGKASEGIRLLKEGKDALEKAGYPVDRILADVTGEYYTLVMESRLDELGQLESALTAASNSKAWQDVYRRFVPLVRSGGREVFREVG